MSWHYLREPGAESLVECCTGGEPLPPLKSRTIHAEFYCNGKLTESYLDSLSGTMCEPSMESRGVERSTSSAADFPVKTSAQLEKAQESKASAAGFGKKWRELSVKYDRHTCSWKTHRCLFQEVLPWSSVTLPKWGMMRNGVLYRHRTLERPISGTESGLLPTPSASDYKGTFRLKRCNERACESPRGVRLPEELARRHQVDLGTHLNPDFVEWLMGWPIGWTDLKPLATDKFLRWRQAHSVFFLGNAND